MDRFTQNIMLTSGKYEEERKYWLAKLDGEINAYGFPFDYERTNPPEYDKKTASYMLSKSVCSKINQISGNSEYAAYIILTSGIMYLMYRYTGNKDIIVGMPVLKQNASPINQANIMPLRSQINTCGSFKSLLSDLKETVNGARKNCNLSFETMTNFLGNNPRNNGSPLFGTIVLWENIHIKEYANEVKADIMFLFKASEGVIRFDMEYNCASLKQSTIDGIAIHLENFFCTALKDPDVLLSQIDILSKEEKETLIYKFNNNKVEYPSDITFCELFREQALKNPGRIAAQCEDKGITYGELDRNSGILAGRLIKEGIKKDSVVGLLADRSIEMLTAILGIWKAGGAYLPIDAAYPAERIKYILTDSGTKILLTDRSLETYGFDSSVISIDIINVIMCGKKEDIPIKLPEPGDLAYVIYTSGSTGNPKGAMVEHRGMLNHLYAKINDLGIDSESIIAQNASHCFDISVWQFFASLVVGGKTVIYTKPQVLDPGKFIGSVEYDGITILELVPSFLSVVLDYCEKYKQNLKVLKHIIVTGETLKSILVKRWFELYPDIKMVNAYGPTEAADDITHYIMDKAPSEESIPLGRPIQNMNIYITDGDMNLCPLGVKGEICVSGPGVGRGYLNNPGKTKEVFMEDLFTGKGIRLYRTGDLGRWRQDGILEFFGRKDYQVKVRGFRIELGDIESKIAAYPDVKESVVIDREKAEGEKYLCAYLVSDKKINIPDLRKYLLDRLADNMVPSYFVILDKLPMTNNGKVDRKALPEPEGRIFSGVEYIEPRNENQRTIVEIWQQVLGIDTIGILDNFFELGGDSIKAIQICARLNECGYKVDVGLLFQHPTIEEFGEYLKGAVIDKEEAFVSTGEVVKTSGFTYGNLSEDTLNKIKSSLSAKIGHQNKIPGSGSLGM